MSEQFVHLNIHSEFSLIDSMVRIKPLAKRCSELGMTTLALTDFSNVFGLIKFYSACINQGIKPIIGAELAVNSHNTTQPPFRLLLLCQNQTGYHHLLQLISQAYRHGQVQGVPMIEKQWLEDKNEGLIVLSSGLQGDVGMAIASGHLTLAEQLVQFWQQLFPQRFYLEIQRTGQTGEENYIAQAVTFANQYQLPLVATNAVRFLATEDFEAHEARVCIHDGTLLSDKRRQRKYSEQQFLRTPSEMAMLFSDLPQAIANSVEISKRCNVFLHLSDDFLPSCPELQLQEHFLPEFQAPNNQPVLEYLTQQAQQGLQQRLKSSQVASAKHDEYQSRLTHELSVITKMGFAGYFLIVADFIQWAKNNDIPVGPGRGSGAGSLVAYALQITDLDPLQYDLLFERFLNIERVSMPDFDIDFCVEGRDRVIDFVAEKYGRESVSQIITFGTMAARAVVRDVGRVLGFPYGFVDKLAKLIPFELEMTLAKALQQEETLKTRYHQEDEVRTVIDLAQSLEGLARNAGTHAAGVVIAPSALTDFTALYCEQGSNSLATHFDKKDIEAVGLVKFDFLGLRNLTVIHAAIKMINQRLQQTNKPPFELTTIPLEDEKTALLLQSCQTTAIFQLESRGIKELIAKLQPTGFADIIPLVALFRPGPLQSGMVDDFIECRHGRKRIEYLHPDLEPILESTYGVILYQEQVMKIAQTLAGYSLGEADILRAAMGKKKASLMAQQRLKFINGAAERKISEQLAGKIFDLMEKFAGYGFNKSHSAAYGLIAYQTAYLKAHYPAEFMAAVLSSDMDNTDKELRFFKDAKALGLTILPPDINNSIYTFKVNDEGDIIYGLGAIKGAGKAALESILAERQQQGKFCDLFDFCRRNDLRKVNKRVLEALIKSGAMDTLGSHRAELLANLPLVLQATEQQQQHRHQHDLFGDFTHSDQQAQHLVTTMKWNDRLRLQAEKETLGLYLSGHPVNCYHQELSDLGICPLKQLSFQCEQKVIMAGVISAIRTMLTKRGERMAFITLEDNEAEYEVALFADIYQTNKKKLDADGLIIIEGHIKLEKFSGKYRLRCENIFDITEVRQRYARYLRLTLPKEHTAPNRSFSQRLGKVLRPFCGGSCPIHISYQQQHSNAEIILGTNWQVTPSDALLDQLKTLLPAQNINIIY